VRRPRKPDSDAAEADERTVRTAALALLAGRDFGRAEIAGRLARRGYPEAVVAAVVERLVAERLLSETRFVEQFIRQHAGRGHGPVRIRAELRERGVPDGEIEAGLDAAGEDWTAVAREVRRRRFGLSPPGDYPERARQARFLQYRGFSAEQIRAALGPREDIEP
jgi:regulatory protein